MKRLAPIFVAIAILSLVVFAGEWAQDFIVLNSTIEHPIELSGDATVWDDLRAPAETALAVPGREPASIAYKTNLLILEFEYQAVGANEEAVALWMQTPHDRKDNTNLDLHAHWTPSDNSSCVVRWCADYSCAAYGGSFSATTNACANETINTQADEHIVTDIVSIDGSSLGISSMCGLRIYRNSSNVADTCSSTEALLLEIDMHYEVDTLGSRSEYSK